MNKCDHDWTFQDDSFDHAFGTEYITYMECQKCGAQKDDESSPDPDDDESED